MKLPQGAEWIILLLIVVLLFGAKRLPDAARGLGRSLRIFKAETKALTDDGAPSAAQPATPPAVTDTPSATSSQSAPAPQSPAAPVSDEQPVNVPPPGDQRPA